MHWWRILSQRSEPHSASTLHVRPTKLAGPASAGGGGIVVDGQPTRATHNASLRTGRIIEPGVGSYWKHGPWAIRDGGYCSFARGVQAAGGQFEARLTDGIGIPIPISPAVS